jgi:hypothetical protein
MVPLVCEDCRDIRNVYSGISFELSVEFQFKVILLAVGPACTQLWERSRTYFRRQRIPRANYSLSVLRFSGGLLRDPSIENVGIGCSRRMVA